MPESSVPTRLQVALADQYDLEREIGRGGMAIVYLARDLKHDRQVAIKVLLPDLASVLGPERFRREIQLVSHLIHPHILPVYDSGEADGSLFYAMPFVKGESLRDRLDRERQLSVPDAIRIVSEVASALDHAHRYGVVHRDIKPENILLGENGEAMVADFGIARAVSAVGDEKLTKTGVTLGTPTYMSPEQATAERHLDGRSDIYALGCVLYEMLAGTPPFTGPNAQTVIARHTLDNVPSVSLVRHTIPEHVDQVIRVAMAKVPADRFQCGADFASALADGSMLSRYTAARSAVRQPASRPWRRPQLIAAILGPILLLGGGGLLLWGASLDRSGPPAVAGGLDPTSLAVMYFEDHSPDGQLAFLADGLTEGLIEELSQVRGLNVVSRNGVAQFRDSAVDRDSIARALRVGTLILGSVEPVGTDRVRVTTRLADGGSGADFERASFVLPRDDLLAVRDSAARDISRFLRVRLGEEVQLRERRLGTTNADAWTLVLRATRLRTEAQELGRENLEDAITVLSRADSLLALAARLDPAWVEPAIMRTWIAFDGALLTQGRAADRQEWVSTGVRHAGHAFEMAPGDPRAREARGTIRYLQAIFSLDVAGPQRERMLDAAQADLEAAVRDRPTLATAQTMLSFLHHDRKDLVSSVLAARRAYEADAYLRNANVILDRLFSGSYHLSQFFEARRWCNEGTRRFPGDHRFVSCQLWMLTAPDAQPDVDQAWRLLAGLDSLAPPRGGELVRRIGRMIVGGVIARAGLADSARAVLESARAEHDVDPRQELLGYEAVMRVMLGEADTAVALLRRYVAANPDHSFQVGGNVHWWWRDLRNHPGFADVLAIAH